MKIGFDARMIQHPGIGRYIKNLLGAMFKQAGGHEFVLFGDSKTLSDINHASATVEIIECSTRIYEWGESFFSPFKKSNIDVMHVPHFNMPILEKAGNLVVTIHDLIYLKFPESVPDFMKGIAVRCVIKNAIKKADKIIAVSENTKKDIIALCPESKGKIEVIYEAVDPVFDKISDADIKKAVRSKYNLPQDIILFVGSLKKHKNIEKLISAYKNLRSKGIKHKLVIIGRYRPREKSIFEKIKQTDAIYLGEVPSEDLAVIYNLASVLVHPSLYEGFGLTVLEAMACGTPAVCSGVSSLPEIAGNAAVLVNPYNEDEISDVVYSVLTDNELRNSLINKGLKRAAQFSWDETAKKTLGVYRSICG